MMLDNMKLILPFFNFNEGNDMFMHCQIVCRAKDHKDKKVKEGAINYYLIKSREHLERLMPEIILLCEDYGARAYINVAGKDFDVLQKTMMATLAKDICEGVTRDLSRVLNSEAGKIKSRSIRWVVDVDTLELKDKVYKWLEDAIKRQGNPDYYIHTIPTPNGCHFITLFKFDTLAFNQEFPDVRIHKNSMGTLLYYPKSLEGNG